MRQSSRFILLYEKTKKIVLSVVLFSIYFILYPFVKKEEPSFGRFTLTLAILMLVVGSIELLKKKEKVLKSFKFEFISRIVIVFIGLAVLYEGKYYYQPILLITLGFVFLVDLCVTFQIRKT